MGTEVELKLSARSADLVGLKRALIAMAPGAVRSQERLVGTYYDTQDLALSRRGLTLRVREHGGRFIQTVKADASAGADVLSRGEWEDVLAENRPNPDAPQSGARLPADLAGCLRPLFITDVTRTAFEIAPLAGTRIEAVIDEGEVRVADGGSAEPIGEIELELKRGSRAALYDVALRLLDAAPVRIELRSKAERGYRLAEGRPISPGSVHAESVCLDPGMTVEAALQQIGRNCFAQLLRNEAAALAGDPEGVHQMRVALRRVRSATSSLKTMLPVEDRRWLREELRWLAGVLAPLRTLDVFATELLPQARAGLPHEPGWDELAAALDRLRKTAHDRAREEILSPRYTATMLGLLRWVETGGRRARGPLEATDPLGCPIGEIAPTVLDRRRRRACRRSKGFGRLTPPQRHELRIAAKKLRYTIELFASLFDQDALSNFVGRLKRLQDDLGYANDIRAAHEFLPQLFTETDPRSSAARAWISVLEWHDQILAGRERKLRKHLHRLNCAVPFWQS